MAAGQTAPEGHDALYVPHVAWITGDVDGATTWALRPSQSESRMPEIGPSGSISGDGKRSDATWPKPPRPSSTPPECRSERLADVA